MKSKVVYADNQEHAKSIIREDPSTKGYVPVKAKYSGTKHGARTYIVWYRKRK